MTRFSKQFWKSSKRSRKSAFGGTVKSQKEIKNLNQKIKAVEKEEFDNFEADFDKILKNL